MLELAFNPTLDGVETMTFTEDKNGILHGTWFPRKGIRHEIQLDPKIGNRAISRKTYVMQELSHDIRVTWKAWANGGLMLESVAYTLTPRNATYQWTLTEFDSLKAAPANKFQPGDLEALPSSTVIDSRDPDNIQLIRQPMR